MQSIRSKVYRAATALVGLGLIGNIAWAGGEGAGATDPHAQHHQGAASNTDVRRTLVQYNTPNVSLTRDDGRAVNLPAELDDGRPVVMNFVYTSCTTICPLSSQTFEQFQGDLGSERASVHLVSISIDPEQDTPARLRAYAAQFHAQKGWDHYSGSLVSVLTVQKAFNAYRGDKMNHSPLTLMRAAPGKPWIRFDGFARADDLMAEADAWEKARSTLVAR